MQRETGHAPQGKAIHLPKKHPSGIDQEPCQDGGGIAQGTAQDTEESKDAHTVRMGRKKTSNRVHFSPGNPPLTPDFQQNPRPACAEGPHAAARPLHGISAEGDETQMCKRADSAAPSPQAHPSPRAPDTSRRRRRLAGLQRLLPAIPLSPLPRQPPRNVCSIRRSRAPFLLCREG